MSGKKEKIDQLFEKIMESRHCAAFTGAGISTLSGIRDFRGKNGLYTAKETAPDAEKIFDIAYFEQDPSFYYKAAADFIYNLDEKKPSVVHEVLAELEKRGIVKAVITQNIDLLHQKAGSRTVLEIHGSPSVHYCLRCAGVRTPFEEAARIVKSGNMPICPHCGRVLKPAITFFGEALPVNAFRQAQNQAENADFMLVLGSSLTVNPVALIPQMTLRNGGEIAIVNNMATHLDRNAFLLFDDLESTFEGLKQRLSE
jgi:NAD-dependent deacetylase